MPYAQKLLYDEISELSVDKVGKVLSYVRFIKRDEEPELIIEPDEEAELLGLLSTDEFIGSEELLAKIRALPND